MTGCCLLAFSWMAGSRDRAGCCRGGPLEPNLDAYGSLYDMGGARGTSGAEGTDSFIAPLVGGGICWLCRRRCEVLRETPLPAGAAATGRAVLLGIVLDIAGVWTGMKVGCASTGRRYELRFCGRLSDAL
jgi:hypothetical protein